MMAGGPTSMWLMDAMSASDGTAMGISEVLLRRLQTVPREIQPAWMREAISDDERKKVLMKHVSASFFAQYHMRSEAAKGKSLEEIYEELKPLVGDLSRPLTTAEIMDHGIEAAGNSFGDDTGRENDAEFEFDVAKVVPSRFVDALPGRKPAMGRDLVTRRPRVIPPATLPGGPLVPMAPVPAPGPMEEVNISEPLMLLGSLNGWSLQQASTSHQMHVHKARKQDPNTEERRLRVQVPPKGLTFIVVSSGDNGLASLRLQSKDGVCELEDGTRRKTEMLRSEGAGPKESLKDNAFFIAGVEGGGKVDVKVALHKYSPAEVWFNDVD